MPMNLSAMNRLSAGVLLAAALSPLVLGPAHAQAPSPAQTLVTGQSELSFVATQVGVPLNGRFKAFSVQSNFNPKAPAAGQIAFTVDLGSVSMGAETDAELVKPEWFNTARFPKATFQSSAIRAMGPGRFEVTGKLSIKGIARELKVPVQLSQAQGLSTATGAFTLRRLDHQIGAGDWSDTSVVANDVQVKFKLVLQGMPAM